MCNFLVDSLVSIHYNRSVNKAPSCYSSFSCKHQMTRRKSSPLIPTVHACEPQDAMKHPTSCVAATTTIDDIDLAKQAISQDQDGEYDQFDNMDTCCGCGIILAKGWACDNCRISCPGCNRSLANDPLEYCSRCNSQCQEHGLYKNVDFKSCPSCV